MSPVCSGQGRYDCRSERLPGARAVYTVAPSLQVQSFSASEDSGNILTKARITNSKKITIPF